MGRTVRVDLGALERTAVGLFGADGDGTGPHGRSLALVVQQGGDVVFERYGTMPDTAFGPGGPVGADTALISWSMAKSITHALVGLLVADGLLDPSAPAPVAAWRGTPKEHITLQHLLTMTPGLEFVEDYVDAGVSNCIEMLFGAGRDDMAAYAATLPLVHEPGTVWNYSSGTTNIVAAIVGDVVGGGSEGMEQFMRERLFGPLGITSAVAKFDTVGTFVGSSFVDATARDFARFGALYLRDGVGPDGTRILPAGWVDHARALTTIDDESGFGYGAHWWTWPDLAGSLAAHGYDGQCTLVVPALDLVVVHLGKVAAADRPLLNAALREIVASVG